MRKLILFLLLASPAFAQWANISTNALGVRYDPSIATPTDGFAIVYDGALKAYKSILSGGSPTNVPWGGTAAAGSAGLQHLGIPLYIYPDANWTTVDNTATKTSIIIADDTSGDPPVQDPNYLAAINAAKAKGLTVLMYVPVNYAADSIATVEAKIDKNYTFYAPDGIFFDQAPSAAGSVAYITTLYNYVRAKTGADLVALNPGTTCDEGYAAVSDIIVTFEGTYASYLSYVPDTWTRKYNSIKFWHLVYSTPLANLANAITLTKANGAGWVDITDVAGYTALSSYFAASARQVGYAAGDDVRLPPPPLTAGRIPYDTTTGVTWTATGGTANQVVHGGSTPSYSKVVVADIDSGAATNTFVATANGSGGVTWAAQSGGGGGTFGSPVSVNSANSDGVAVTYARSDHVHTIVAGLITNAMVNAAAAIAYSKLALTASIVNADVAVGAAIAYSKLALATSIVNGDISASAAIAYSKLALTGSILNADVNASAAIAYSKLALTGSIVNADINASAAIAYSKLALTGAIVNADVNASAAIAYSKLALTGSVVVADIAAGAKTGTGTKVATDTGASIGTPTITDYVTFTNQSANAGASKRLQNNGANLSFHDGTAARNLIMDNDARLTDLRVATTTGTFVIPAIGSTVTVAITSGAGISTSSGIIIADNAGGHSMIGVVTAGGLTTSLTVQNSGLLAGSVGNTMASGAIVNASALPYTNLGTNNQILTSNGTIGVFAANAAARFRIALMPGAAEITGAASEPLLVGTKGTNSSWSYLAYNDTTLMQGRWVVGGSIVNDYAGGAITLRIRWYATANTGNVVWTVKTLSRAAGTVMDTAYDATNAHTVTTAAAGTTLQLVNSDITWTPIAGELTAGSIYMVQVERTASSGSDTMTGDANVVSATITEN